MIGGLVKQDKVRFQKQDFGQLNAHAPASAEFAGRARKIASEKTQSDKDFLDFSIVIYIFN